MKNGATAGFKYFDFDTEHPTRISIEVRGKAKGKICVYTDPKMQSVAEIPVEAEVSWKNFTADLSRIDGVRALYFMYKGADILTSNPLFWTIKKYNSLKV